MTHKPTFSSFDKNNFYASAKERVQEYFKATGQSKHANGAMWVKTFILFVIYFLAYGAILSNQFSGLWLIGWYSLIGAVMGLFGMNLSHDIMHGAFFKSSRLNKLGSYFFDLNGSSSYVWKATHNQQHHAYTNIPGHDHDIDKAILLRLSPTDKVYSFHAYQHIYAPFLYLFTSLNWMYYADFKFFSLCIKNGNVSIQEKILFYTFKVIYTFIFLILPLMLLSAPGWQIILGFIALHFTGSIIIALVFQLAHIVENVQFPECNQLGKIEDPWAIHELKTTSNFASHSSFLGHLLGGLNFQIEHHLFSHICHVHYSALSPILKKTAREYGVPYIEQPSLFSAIRSHIRTLKRLGNEN